MTKVHNSEHLLTEACLLLARHHFGSDVALEVHQQGELFGARLSGSAVGGDDRNRGLVAAFGDGQREALYNLLVVLRNYRTP